MIVLLLGAFHILSGTTETILSAIATAPFYFLPVLVAYSAAKHFETDPLIAIISVCVMLLPDFSELMESGEKVTFLGIPVVPATYAYSVIPIILLIYCEQQHDHLEDTAGQHDRNDRCHTFTYMIE